MTSTTTPIESTIVSDYALPRKMVAISPASIKRIGFLGTSSAVPQPGRCNVSALNISLSTGSSILVDCGEATQHQLMLSRSIKMGKIDVILITHLHGDHFFGIFGLLASLGTLNRSTPLTVVGPKGLQKALDAVFLAENLEIADTLAEDPNAQGTSYSTKIIELEGTLPITLGTASRGSDPSDPLCLATDIGVDILAIPIEHRVPTFAYRIMERHRSGSLDAAKARRLGAQNSHMAKLKDGMDIHLDDGRVIYSEDVVGDSRPGKSVCVVQDTHDPWKYRHLFDDCDVMIHECTYDDSMKEKAIAFGHSTPSMAASFALATGAKNLILTHFSSRYDREIVQYDGSTRSNIFTTTRSHAQKSAPSDCESELEHCCGDPITPVTSIAGLKAEAERYIADAQSDSNPPQVYVAADFRIFEFNKLGALSQSPEPDLDLSPLFTL